MAISGMNHDDRKILPAHAEMQDAAGIETEYRLAPAAASIELARLLTRFETEISDDWRSQLIVIGGALLRLDAELNPSGGDDG